MAEPVLIPGMRRRFLKFDATTMALKICPYLDRGDREGATAIWLTWRASAERILDRREIEPSVRAALLRAASQEVRREITLIRGSAQLGPVPSDKRPASAAPSAAVIQFRRQSGGAA